MKTLSILLSLSISLVFVQCANKPYGKKVKEPFRGSAYESNNRFFRATGKGSSNSENIARGKADIQAKSQLAGQVNTTMKQVTDQYLHQNENARAADLSEKFESLVRQVMNTQISDLRKIGEEKYYNGSEYTVFMAYEIKKNAMFKFLKKQAKAEKRFNEAEQKAIEEIIDRELKKLEE
jgi:histone acetyltransferase (RNA polymerase elongator complex component)